ncbi:MAG TPA: ATP-binding protein [Rhodocyclaceae bacterium]
MTRPPFAGLLRQAAFKQQLSVAVTTGILLFALLSSLLTSWQGSRQIRQTLLSQGEHIAENLADQSTLALLYASADNALGVVNTTLSFPDVKRVEILQAGGQALIVRGDAIDGAADFPLPDPAARTAYLEAETPDAWRFVAPVRVKNERDSPFEMEQRPEEVLGFVRVVQSKETLSRMLTEIFLTNIAISLFFAGVFLFVVQWLSSRMTEPITALSDAMARAEHGESEVRAAVSGPKDIRDMAQAFNSMISALQERERALRESQANYREVVDSVKEVIFQTDAAGNWVLLNPAWQEIVGLEVAKSLGHSFLDFVHEEDRQLASELQALLKAGEIPSCRFELRFNRADATIGWLEAAQHARWSDDGEFAGTSGTLFDVTERRLAAEKLESLNAELENRVRVRTAQLEASNQELEAFSYSVSHDLRAPLRAIDGFANILLEDYAKALDDAGLGHLQRIRTASQRMSQLIDDLLELARISRADINYQDSDLSAMARDLARELREAEPGRSAEFEIADGLEAHVDPVLMHVVLDNLLRNAWKFTGKRESARIAFGTTQRAASGNGDEITYFVRDNGAGFDMAYADKLFKPFSRLHPATEFAGTGVGLATVQRVIHRHGGRIWAESKAGEGTTFYFSLPAPRT